MVYIALKEQVRVQKKQIFLNDVAQIRSDIPIDKKLTVGYLENGTKLVSAFDLISLLQDKYPGQDIRSIGAQEVFVTGKMPQLPRHKLILKAAFICLLIFFGSGMAIMDFHADVNMQEVHKNVYRFVTGEETETAYWISIPYSVGIAVGVLSFTKVWPFKKKKADPNLLDIEFKQFEKEIIEYKKTREKAE